MTMGTITTLPEEVLLAIFEHLTWKDLCDIVQVCHHFYKVGTDPPLWANATLNKRKFMTSRWEDVGKVFEIPRYKKSHLDLSNCHGISVLRMIHILRQSLKTDISDRDLSGLDLCKIPKRLLSSVVSRSTKANLNKCKGLRPSQLLALFTRCSKSTTLEHLHLEGVDLVSVPPEFLTATIQRLNTISLMCCDCFTTIYNFEVLSLLTLCSKSTTLEHLYLDQSYIVDRVDRIDLMFAVPDLTGTIQLLNSKTLMFCNCFITRNRVRVKKEAMKEAIFNAIINSASLKTVNLMARL